MGNNFSLCILAIFLLLWQNKLTYLCTSLTILILKPTPLHLSSAWKCPSRAKICRSIKK